MVNHRLHNFGFGALWIKCRFTASKQNAHKAEPKQQEASVGFHNPTLARFQGDVKFICK